MGSGSSKITIHFCLGPDGVTRYESSMASLGCTRSIQWSSQAPDPDGALAPLDLGFTPVQDPSGSNLNFQAADPV